MQPVSLFLNATLHALSAATLTGAELNPHTGAEVPPGLLPPGTTLIDGLDTLVLAGRFDDTQTVQAVAGFALGTTTVSVFETFIRVVGGLLGLADALRTVNQLVFLKCVESAAKVADALDVAFADGPVPYPRVDLARNVGVGMPWFPQGCTSVADAGTIFFELEWLAARTGNPRYQRRADGLLDALGAYTWVKIGSGAPCSAEQFTAGAGGDSWYEMLLKTGKRPRLTKRFLAHHDWGSMRATGEGGHLLCIWPIYVAEAGLLRGDCAQLATAKGCHPEPEAAEMLWALNDSAGTSVARTNFAEHCQRQFGYGRPEWHHDPLQHSWVAAETLKYLYAPYPCGAKEVTGTLSTEAHCRRYL